MLKEKEQEARSQTWTRYPRLEVLLAKELAKSIQPTFTNRHGTQEDDVVQTDMDENWRCVWEGGTGSYIVLL